MAHAITDQNFDELLASGKPIVVDFWAEWCGPCRMMSPIVDELYNEYDQQKVVIGKCNVDENDKVAARFSIRSIPTILFIKDGKVEDKQVGATSKSDLKAKIDRLL